MSNMDLKTDHEAGSVLARDVLKKLNAQKGEVQRQGYCDVRSEPFAEFVGPSANRSESRKKDEAGVQTGKKLPLQLVERYMQAKWRTPDDPKERTAIAQHWGRYRKIPEWIERESSRRAISPEVVIAELEAMRVVDRQTKGLNWLRQKVEKLRKQAKQTISVGVSIHFDSLTNLHQVPVASPAASSPVPETAGSDPQSSSTLGPAFQEDLSCNRKRATAMDPWRPPPGKKIKFNVI
ncbi:hypothetical protein K438DRAFT_1776177 [Mycena galopus ATCC 62051]|nr:hypothetical protein K438DRAFT_1776177 [Mycena galopus ATCC 62051]